MNNITKRNDVARVFDIALEKIIAGGKVACCVAIYEACWQVAKENIDIKTYGWHIGYAEVERLHKDAMKIFIRYKPKKLSEDDYWWPVEDKNIRITKLKAAREVAMKEIRLECLNKALEVAINKEAQQ